MSYFTRAMLPSKSGSWRPPIKSFTPEQLHAGLTYGRWLQRKRSNDALAEMTGLPHETPVLVNRGGEAAYRWALEWTSRPEVVLLGNNAHFRALGFLADQVRESNLSEYQ